MAITTTDGLIAATKRRIGFRQDTYTGLTPPGLRSIFSLWGASPMPPAGSAPGNLTTGVIPTQATTGAIAEFTDPSGGQKAYLAQAAFHASAMTSAATGSLVSLMDRVWHAGAFSLVSGATAGFVGLAVTRPTSGDDIEPWIEIVTATGATAHTVTIGYTNQDGTTGRSTTSVNIASLGVGRLIQIALQAGDRGIRKIDSLSGSAANTGSFNLLLLRKIANFGMVSGSDVQDAYQLGLPELYAGSCLFMVHHQYAAFSHTIAAELVIAYG